MPESGVTQRLRRQDLRLWFELQGSHYEIYVLP
ncbi:methyltransferase FkbM family protein [Colletotrichum graminicola M1.001]|uniref:Methyltransferase FkbM family protein n=1 Tax=Colletotrichum graminicola (strain M1.001 / M2 / FGSC 10212) TaxID=645133 RepID=E3R0T9_COLGM|nr:methyltransferase FkbM family protein [Colletotrichum graminicola M1.001]EFQ36727.1 methyltransferase FkbM family protein [Colletotrichum graminicola M1.001]